MKEVVKNAILEGGLITSKEGVIEALEQGQALICFVHNLMCSPPKYKYGGNSTLFKQIKKLVDQNHVFFCDTLWQYSCLRMLVGDENC